MAAQRTVILLDQGDVGTRLDRVLARHLAHLRRASRTRIQTWIATGAVRINGEAVDRASRRLASGDQLDLEVPAPPRRARSQVTAPPLDVLFEDDDLLAVNKPPGQVVHPTRTHTSGTLLQAMLFRAGVSADHANAPRLVTRLDRETSGVVLVAKRGPVHTALQRAAAAGALFKTYLAICIGRVSPARGTIDLHVAPDRGDPRRMAVTDRGGARSVTLYRRLGVVSAGPAGNAGASLSLLACHLVTGRTHQIRVHLAARGWPVLRDATYGSGLVPAFDDGELDAAVRACLRHALHAWSVHVPHPVTGAPLAIVAPAPADLQALLDAGRFAAGLGPPPFGSTGTHHDA